MATPIVEPTLAELVERVGAELADGSFSAESAGRLRALMNRFVAFATQGLRVRIASDVTGEVVERFVRARLVDGSAPAIATLHIRRAAVRLLFAEGRRLGLVDHDPTMDLHLPPRSSLHTRPLTDDEVALCRSHSLRTLTETRQPAAWALAEATARSAEIARIETRHIDLDHGRLWVPGSSKTEPRWATLSDWGMVQLERRLGSMDRPRPDTLLICAEATKGVSATSSASTAIAQTLRRAGLHLEPDVRPASVAAWAGAKAHAEGEPIPRIAQMLGVRSLDRAAALIGWDWRRATPGDLP